MISKPEARELTIRRWRELPDDIPRNFEQAGILAATLAAELDFPSSANIRKLIFAWIVRELSDLPPWGNVPPEDLQGSSP